MPVMPIPDDWNGTDWECFFITWPNSLQWRSILDGLLSTPTRGRFWDGRSGVIVDAQEVGWEIVGRNDDMDCNDLITALQDIKNAIDSVEATQSVSVSIQETMSLNLQAQAIAQSASYAWSTAFAQSTVAVTIHNQVSQVIRPIEPGVDDPPDPTEETPTGISSTTQSSTSTEVCKRAFWMVWTVSTIFDYWVNASIWYQSTVLAFLGAIATGLSLAALKGDPSKRAILIPAAVLVQAAHFLTSLFYEGLIEPCITDLNTWLYNNWEQLVCDVSDGVQQNLSTLAIQNNIIQNYLNYTSDANATKYVNLVPLFFNLNTIAALYYVSSLIGTLPDIPSEYGGNDFCNLTCGA